jgi:hypothetical protein
LTAPQQIFALFCSPESEIPGALSELDEAGLEDAPQPDLVGLIELRLDFKLVVPHPLLLPMNGQSLLFMTAL